VYLKAFLSFFLMSLCSSVFAAHRVCSSISNAFTSEPVSRFVKSSSDDESVINGKISSYELVGCVFTETSRPIAYAGYPNARVKTVIFKGVGAGGLGKVIHIVSPFETDQGLPTGLALLEDQIETFRLQGIDVVYHDFSVSNRDYVQNKSAALKSVMQKIDTYRAGITKPSIMIGLSMGGVVGRYALASFEQEGYRHGVKYFISFDSPHRGAFIPRSLQHIPQFMKDAANKALSDNSSLSIYGKIINLWGDSTVKNKLNLVSVAVGELDAFINDQMTSPAAKQMLITNIYYPNTTAPERVSLLNALDNLGMPKGLGLATTNIAVVKGSLSGKKFIPEQTDYLNTTIYNPPNTEGAIKKVYVRASVVGALKTAVYLDAAPGCRQSSCMGPVSYYFQVFDGELRYKDLSESFGDGADSYYAYQSIHSNSTQIEDSFSCSTLNLAETIATAVNSNFSGVEAKQKASCFIPTYSALGKKSASDTKSYFHRVYGSSENNSHDKLDNGEVFLEQTSGRDLFSDITNEIIPAAFSDAWNYRNCVIRQLNVGFSCSSSSCGESFGRACSAMGGVTSTSNGNFSCSTRCP